MCVPCCARSSPPPVTGLDRTPIAIRAGVAQCNPVFRLEKPTAANTKGSAFLHSRESPMPVSTTVTVPARIHLGFLDLNGRLGRRFGSIGLALSDLNTKVA